MSTKIFLSNSGQTLSLLLMGSLLQVVMRKDVICPIRCLKGVYSYLLLLVFINEAWCYWRRNWRSGISACRCWVRLKWTTMEMFMIWRTLMSCTWIKIVKIVKSMWVPCFIYIYIWMQLNLCLVIYYSWTLQGKPGSSLAKDKDILLKFQVCKGACLFVNSMKTFK